MPMFEIEDKFCRSELAIVSWRSQETYHQMTKKLKKNGPTANYDGPRPEAIVPEGLPDKFYNENGEIDLRQVTGAEAWKFMQAQGIKLPIIHPQNREK